MSSPETWIQQIAPELLSLLETTSPPFSFPLEKIAEVISSSFNISPLSVQVATCEWKEYDNFFAGIGSSPFSLSFQLAPLEGDLFWIMDLSDIRILISWLRDKLDLSVELDSPDLVKGLYRYITLIGLAILSQASPYRDLSVKITERARFEENGYAIDLSFQHNDQTVWGRLILSAKAKRALNAYLDQKPPTLASLTEFPSLKVPLSITNGSVELTQTEFDSLRVGDVIVVENAHFRPREEKGSLKVYLGKTPLFQVKSKEGSLKILDYLFSYEEASHVR